MSLSLKFTLSRRAAFTAAALVAVGLFVALVSAVGCDRAPENLAHQIGPITATLGPNVDGEGRPIQEVRYSFTNNGPKDIGAVYAQTTMYDAEGNRTNDSTTHYCIFASATPAERLRPGQTYQTAAGHGYLLLNGTAVKVESVPVDATESSNVEAITEGAKQAK